MECIPGKIFKDLLNESAPNMNHKQHSELVGLGRYLIRLVVRKELEKSEEENVKENHEYGFNYRFKYEDVLQLCSNRNLMVQQKLQLLEMVSEIVHESLQKCKNLRDKVTQDELFTLACIEETNAFGFYFPLTEEAVMDFKDGGSSERLYAFGLHPMHAMFNHSCAPNLYKFKVGKTYALRALHDIPKGTELCITYIDLYPRNANQRQAELKNHYGFYCCCKRCEQDEIWDEYERLYVCGNSKCGGLMVCSNSDDETRKCNVCGAEKEED